MTKQWVTLKILPFKYSRYTVFLIHHTDEAIFKVFNLDTIEVAAVRVQKPNNLMSNTVKIRTDFIFLRPGAEQFILIYPEHNIVYATVQINIFNKFI